MTERRVLLLPLLLVGCAVDGVSGALTGDGAGAADEEKSTGQAVSCAPLMNTFPLPVDHNIGYDDPTCGSGHCETGCPGPHPNSDWGGAHHGIDLFAYYRAPIVAVVDGTIVRAGWFSDTSGYRVRLRDACGWEYWYGHFDELAVTAGQRVNAGDLLGYMGSTGTRSVHLHFNVDRDGDYENDINPFNLLLATEAASCAPPPPPPPPPPPEGCGGLGGDAVLGADQSMPSCDGRFALAMQADGNLVLYEGDTALWSSGTSGSGGNQVVMQSDGNLVIYASDGTPVWSSQTSGRDGATLSVQDDGNLVMYQGDAVVWQSHTCCH